MSVLKDYRVGGLTPVAMESVVNRLKEQGFSLEIKNEKNPVTNEYLSFANRKLVATHEFWVQADDVAVLSLLSAPNVRLAQCKAS